MATRLTLARVFTLVVLTSRVLCSQDHHFRYFGVAEGLTNLGVKQIYQDQVGFLWLSTENGIFRYDGDRFEVFGPDRGIPATSGASFGEAPDGTLLVGGDFGLYHLSGSRFEKVSLPARWVNWAQGIQADGKGHSFVSTDSGLMELYTVPGAAGREEFADRFKVRRFPRVQGTSGPEVHAVFVEGDIVWYGCGLQICRMDANGARILGRESGLPDCVWKVIRKDGEGNLWVRGKNEGVFELPRGQTRFRRPDSPFPPDALVGVPATDADGRMLFPSPAGLLIHDETGWQRIGRPAGLRGTVYAAFEDRQHALWIGLAGRGLARWRGYREWESYTEESGLATDVVYEILPLPGASHTWSLWVATEAGLFRGTRQASGILWKKVAGVGDLAVHSIRRAPDGDLWIGTKTHGAARIHAATNEVEWLGADSGLTAKAPYTLRFDRQQRLWAATDAGLFMAQAPYRKFSRIDQLPATRFWAVEEGAGNTIWAGGADGLFACSAGRWKNYTPADGLSNLEVLALGASADGKVWIGYRHGGGIDRVRATAGGVAIERAVQRHGSDGVVYFLDFDASGRLWAGTERGVDMWDGSHWSHYDTTDGLAWDDCNLHAFAAEADGTVWIGTSGGLSRFKARPNSLAKSLPKVVFTRLVIGRTDVAGQLNPSVSIRSNSLMARYSALNAPRENGLVFRYRLLPVRSTWTETTQRDLQFAELAPGAYRLEVEARDSDGVWSGYAGEFPFEILTPWYRRWWFMAACGLTPMLTIAAVLRWRILAASQRERQLVRMVEDKTADLRRANENLLRLSSLDPLTGLANRRVFDQALENECARLKRSQSAVSLAFLDIDYFKALNDSEGHQRGDSYLARVSAELTSLVRRHVDVAARYGGEEFAVILPETNASGAARFAEQVRLAISSLALPHPASPVAPVLTVSVGVSTATPDCCSTPVELMAAADHALYQAKRGGRNRVVVASDAAILHHT